MLQEGLPYSLKLHRCEVLHDTVFRTRSFLEKLHLPTLGLVFWIPELEVKREMMLFTVKVASASTISLS